MIKKMIKLFQKQLFLISIIIYSTAGKAQTNQQNIDLQKVESINNGLIEVLQNYIKTKDSSCSESSFYYYIRFDSKENFSISRVHEDYNNFIEGCSAYIEIMGQYILVTKNDFWKDYFVETARYKSFFYYKTNNEYFIPFGYQSDSKYYKILDGIITLERTKPCSYE